MLCSRALRYITSNFKSLLNIEFNCSDSLTTYGSYDLPYKLLITDDNCYSYGSDSPHHRP